MLQGGALDNGLVRLGREYGKRFDGIGQLAKCHFVPLSLLAATWQEICVPLGIADSPAGLYRATLGTHHNPLKRENVVVGMAKLRVLLCTALLGCQRVGRVFHCSDGLSYCFHVIPLSLLCVFGRLKCLAGLLPNRHADFVAFANWELHCEQFKQVICGLQTLKASLMSRKEVVTIQ